MKNMRRVVPWAIVDSLGVGLLGFLTLAIMTRVLTPVSYTHLTLPTNREV